MQLSGIVLAILALIHIMVVLQKERRPFISTVIQVTANGILIWRLKYIFDPAKQLWFPCRWLYVNL